LKRREAALLLWPYLKPYWPAFFLSALLSIPLAALSLGPAPFVKYLSDEVLVKRDPIALQWVVMAVPLVFALNFILRFLTNYLVRSASNRMIQRLRNDLFQHLLRLEPAYFHDSKGGVLVSRMVSDVQLIVRAASSVVDLVKEPLVLMGALGYAFYLNWKLTLITLLVIPPAALLLNNAGRHAKRYSYRILDKLGEMSALAGETISGVKVVQAFQLEGTLKGQFMQLNRDFTRTSLKAIRMEELSRPAIEFAYGLALAAVVYFAGRAALKGSMSAGDVIAFFTCFAMLLQPVKKLSELVISLNQSAAAVDSVFSILRQQPRIFSPERAVPWESFTNSIELKNVSFGFEEHKIFENLSLEVKKGEVVALVGPSGAGKTTLLHLLLRFFDPVSGTILIDGKDIRLLNLSALRRKMALVSQDVFLFHDSVAANIRAGRYDLPESSVLEAAEAAQALSVTHQLAEGMDTVIGERGQKLSGGERQRISIARALLRNAPILLLDEATSALDGENERMVQRALDRLLEGRTAIVVAHRLSTIRRAHRIVVLEKGRIVEQGTHEELLKLSGHYAKALALQGLGDKEDR
jgi:ATP-binding cassette, subfamily B, bacterial MsbA